MTESHHPLSGRDRQKKNRSCPFEATSLFFFLIQKPKSKCLVATVLAHENYASSCERNFAMSAIKRAVPSMPKTALLMAMW